MKKLLYLLVMLCFLVTGCGKTQEKDSLFIGTWHCGRVNSCNDMDITLKIYPVYRYGEIELYFERDMKSPTGIGSSNITGTIDIPTSTSTTVYDLNAKWSISGNTLIEVFTGNGNKTNIYRGMISLRTKEALRKEESYTINDIYALPDGERAELIDGKIYYMAPPKYYTSNACNGFILSNT